MYYFFTLHFFFQIYMSPRHVPVLGTMHREACTEVGSQKPFPKLKPPPKQKQAFSKAKQIFSTGK